MTSKFQHQADTEKGFQVREQVCQAPKEGVRSFFLLPHNISFSFSCIHGHVHCSMYILVFTSRSPFLYFSQFSHKLILDNIRLQSSTSETSWRRWRRRSSRWTKKRALGSVINKMRMRTMMMLLFLKMMEFQFRCLPFSSKNWINFERKTSKFRDPEHLLSPDQRKGDIKSVLKNDVLSKKIHDHHPDCTPELKTFKFLRY